MDVRSNAEPSYPCDVLGDKQWKWLEEQLRNGVAELTIIGSGMQVGKARTQTQSIPSRLRNLFQSLKFRQYLVRGYPEQEKSCTGGHPFYNLKSHVIYE